LQTRKLLLTPPHSLAVNRVTLLPLQPIGSHQEMGRCCTG
jgi:hypothetical protein